MDIKKIKTWQEAFKAKKLDVKALPDVSMIPEQYRKPVIAHYILNVVAEVLNGDWKADYTDNSQYKYFPWFVVNADKKRPSGFGLSCGDYGRWFATTASGVRLCFKDRETAEYAGKIFLALYEDLYLPYNS